MKNNNELLLYERLTEGDEKALEEVYNLYKDEFVNFFRKYEISRQDIIDIYQDSIIVVFQKFVSEKVRLEKSSLKTYLFGIGKNKMYDYFKRKKITTNEILDLEVNDEEFQFQKQPSLYEKKLAEGLKSLSNSCQDILKLFYYRSLTIKEIVMTTEYKDENTVKSHKSRCLKKLKDLCNS